MQLKIKEYEIYDANTMRAMMQDFCKQTNRSTADIDIAIKILNQGNFITKAYLGTLNSDVIGYVIVGITYPLYAEGMILEVKNIYVKPKYRKNNLAKGMLDLVIKEYEKAISVIADVEKDNLAALKLMDSAKFSHRHIVRFEKISN